jgi:hypothetical protein
MENDKNIEETITCAALAKEVFRNNYQKTIQKLERRNAHLKTNSAIIKKNKEKRIAFS